jgi:hypothetical protein
MRRKAVAVELMKALKCAASYCTIWIFFGGAYEGYQANRAMRGVGILDCLLILACRLGIIALGFASKHRVEAFPKNSITST